MNIQSIKQTWFSNVRGDTLAGIVVALALIPEAIAFSIIAGVDPMVGLYASFTISVIIAFVGGRPGMISAATGAMALLMVNLVADHGLQYLLAATILTGIIQVIFGVLKLARYMKFIPRTVMVAFVNSLAILIFLAQLPHFVGESWVMYMMVAVALVIIYVLPRFTKLIPSPLVAIVLITAFAIMNETEVRTVGDLGQLTQSLPDFLIPSVPFNLTTLMIILPYSLALAIVGLLESLLTASIVDDMTETPSDKNQESRGQGIANVVTGFFGGMAGCAMIGQSVINVKSGGTGRLSALVAGVFLMFLIIVLGDWVAQIPMAVLVAVMFMVSFGTFDWSSIRTLRVLPRTDAFVLIVTVLVVVFTHNLAIGVLAGILLSAIFFAGKISKVHVEAKFDPNRNKKTYLVQGQIFFVSVTDFLNAFEYDESLEEVEINFSEAQLWDDSAVAALEKVILKYKLTNTRVTLTGLNKTSNDLIEKMSGAQLSGH